MRVCADSSGGAQPDHALALQRCAKLVLAIALGRNSAPTERGSHHHAACCVDSLARSVSSKERQTNLVESTHTAR
eukprot:3522503-Pleurochrysis_carterae.AAC.2